MRANRQAARVRRAHLVASLLLHLALLCTTSVVAWAAPVTQKTLNAGRPFLVVAAAGDASQHENSWLDDRHHRNWDLLLIYYGSDVNFTCPDCIGVLQNRGAKWRLVWELSQTDLWQALQPWYKAVMVADDDLLMSTHVINRSFQVFSEKRLLLGQPSVCRHSNSLTRQQNMMQRKGSLVTFTPLVEVTAPMIDMTVFRRVVIPTLEDAYMGWGLDYVWPFLLGFPRDKVGVIDAVCMHHPKLQAPKPEDQTSIETPYGPNGVYEMIHFLNKYGINKTALEAHDLPEDLRLVPPFGSIPLEVSSDSQSVLQLQLPAAEWQPGAHDQTARNGSTAFNGSASSILGPTQVLLIGAVALVIGSSTRMRRLRSRPGQRQQPEPRQEDGSSGRSAPAGPRTQVLLQKRPASAHSTHESV